jgi:RHS repeat-associated protein
VLNTRTSTYQSPINFFVNPLQNQKSPSEKCVNAYTFGFNGQEKDDETYGDGNAIAYEARIYDSRLGKWFSLDPLMKKYANESNYIFTSNNPILYKDIEGKDKIVGYTVITDFGSAHFEIITKNEVMFTYVEKYSNNGGGGAGSFTFTDIRQDVVIDKRTNIKPEENKSYTSAEYSGKELGLIEGGRQKFRSLQDDNPTQISGYVFSSGSGGEIKAPKSKKTPGGYYDLTALLTVIGPLTKSSSLEKLNPEELGKALTTIADNLKSQAEAAKGVQKEKAEAYWKAKAEAADTNHVCTGCGATVGAKGHNNVQAAPKPTTENE